MRSSEIRSTFLDFFSERDHRVVPSGPLIPADPTLLLTNAGMNQFIPYFLGEAEPPRPRAASAQKCARTVDIDNVGRTTRHATFFEMLGNFSFGDYFKAEAVAWAWELLTRVYGLDPGRLWATVYEDDDEAERLWRRIGVPADRIQRLGMADNYWSMGVPGPCGPSSELHYDRGPDFGEPGGPAVNGERYLELWNLVFMQSRRGEGPAKEGYPILGELPAKNIDTGLGLGRLAAILQGVDSDCETDLLLPALRTVEELAGRPYPGRHGGAPAKSFRVVVDHSRTAAFLIGDGVLPGNEGRGYVLRRLLRRAIRHARLLGIDRAALTAVTGAVTGAQGDAWPELRARNELIERVVAAEERSFGRTLRQGSKLLDAAISRARGRLSGEAAFELHDTHGFPIDLTIDAAREAGLTVDEDRFHALLAEQRRRAHDASRSARGGGQGGGQGGGHGGGHGGEQGGEQGEEVVRRAAHRRIAAAHGPTSFVGYDATAGDGRLVALLRDGEPGTAAGEGAEVEVFLDRTPFYAEAGGQVGDAGAIRTAGGELRVLDTRPGPGGLYVHRARVVRGEVRTGEEAEAIVDADRRAAVARSHSATHVLHAMLRRALGEHAGQRGSLVAAGRLRFDFAHFGPLDPATLRAVESMVNDHLLADPEVRVWHAGRAEAERAGALAMFGEKYGDQVRIVDIGDFSRELCGGTHVGHGSQAGPVRILGESSIGANLRRIEALTGPDALRHHDHERTLLGELAGLLGTPPDQAPRRLREKLDTLAAAERELDRLRREELSKKAADLARGAERGRLVVERADGVRPGDLRPLAAEALDRLPGGPGIVVLGAAGDGRASLVAAVAPDLADGGLRAGDLLQEAARAVGGGAGGRGRIANAGGRHPEHLGRALALAADRARRELLGR